MNLQCGGIKSDTDCSKGCHGGRGVRIQTPAVLLELDSRWKRFGATKDTLKPLHPDINCLFSKIETDTLFIIDKVVLFHESALWGIKAIYVPLGAPKISSYNLGDMAMG